MWSVLDTDIYEIKSDDDKSNHVLLSSGTGGTGGGGGTGKRRRCCLHTPGMLTQPHPPTASAEGDEERKATLGRKPWLLRMSCLSHFVNYLNILLAMSPKAQTVLPESL